MPDSITTIGRMEYGMKNFKAGQNLKNIIIIIYLFIYLFISYCCIG